MTLTMNIKKTTSHLIESNQVFICDFNDSFTFNIFSDFKNLGHDSVVVGHEETDFWNRLLKKEEKFILILGPGPGHPFDYDFCDFKPFFDLKNCFIFGVCLGHQLSLLFLGAKVIESSNKLHGQTVTLKDTHNLFFDNMSSLIFQRYNSLTVDISSLPTEHVKSLYDENSELMLFSYKDNFLSCQFHPESVGTNCPNSLYYLVTNFLI